MNIFLNYEQSILLMIGIAIFFLIVLMAKMIRNRRKYTAYKKPIFLSSLGLAIVLASLIFEGFESGCWDLGNIIGLLALTRANKDCGYTGDIVTRLVVLDGYFFFLWGMANVIIVRMNRFKKTM